MRLPSLLVSVPTSGRRPPSCAAAERSTASVISAALAPSAKVGSPSTASTAGRDGAIGVGDEGVEAVLVTLRVTGGSVT